MWSGGTLSNCSRKKKESKKGLNQLEKEINSYHNEPMREDNKRVSELEQERDELISGLTEGTYFIAK